MSESRPWHEGDARQIYSILAEMVARGEEGVLATVIRTARSVPRHAGSKMIIRADGAVTGSVGGGSVEAAVVEQAGLVVADGQCRRVVCDLTGADGVCGGEVEVFLEPVLAAVPLWVVGAGHVGRALLEAGGGLAMRFHVVDDRPGYLEGLEPARAVEADPEGLVAQLTITPRTVILIASRDHALDGRYLESVFQAEESAGARCAYIGVVGSRTKARVLSRRFAGQPGREARMAEVRIPVGLAIGAETPAEIALSILSDVLAHLRGAPWLTDDDGNRIGLYRLADRPRDPEGSC